MKTETQTVALAGVALASSFRSEMHLAMLSFSCKTETANKEAVRQQVRLTQTKHFILSARFKWDHFNGTTEPPGGSYSKRPTGCNIQSSLADIRKQLLFCQPRDSHAIGEYL